MKHLKNLFTIFLVFTSCISFGAEKSHNLLPRMPHLVLEQGSSSDFSVESLTAEARMDNYQAETELNVAIKNVSGKDLNVPLKIRVLYPKGKNAVSIKLNNKSIRYNQEKPSINLSLKAGETSNIFVSATVSTNYSKDNVKKAVIEKENERKGKKKSKIQSLGESFASYFNQETYGTRFMIGSLVSKWGLFPVAVKQASIVVRTGKEIIAESDNNCWAISRERRGKRFTCTSAEGFEDTVFLPEKDREDFLMTQKIISSGMLNED